MATIRSPGTKLSAAIRRQQQRRFDLFGHVHGRRQQQREVVVAAAEFVPVALQVGALAGAPGVYMSVRYLGLMGEGGGEVSIRGKALATESESRL
jgi:hypothetical protein